MLQFHQENRLFPLRMRTSTTRVLAMLLLILATHSLAWADAVLDTTTITSTITVATTTITITLSRSSSVTTAATVVSYTTMAPSTSTFNAGQELVQAAINSTNYYRQTYEAAPLSWNSTLAIFASAHAQKCIWEHSGGPYGENLAAGYVTVALAIDAWGNEEGKYNWGKQGFSEETGHFTQLVWKDTTSVGCGLVECDNQAQGGVRGPYLVCEYSPRGNVDGEYVHNVRKAGVGADGKLAMGGAEGRGNDFRPAVAALVVACLLMSALMIV